MWENLGSFGQLIEKGGPVIMVPLMICSVIALAVIIERTLALWRASSDSGRLMEGIREAVLRGDIQGAIEMAENTPGPSAAVIANGLRNYHLDQSEIERTMEELALAEVPELSKRLAWLAYQGRDLRAAAAIHVTSEAEADGVRRVGLRTPVAVIPNGIDVPESLPPRAPGGFRRALFLSRLHPKKGLPLLVRAWAATRPEGWELVVAGPDEGGHRAEVEALAEGLGLGEGVRFLGPVDDARKWELYRTADLFVLPTHSENFGLVVAEALAAGVPVITTRGAPWSALLAERCGWWVDVGVEPLAGALADAVALDDERRQRMGDRGRRFVLQHLSWERVAHEVRSLYEWLLDRQPRPPFVFT